MIGIDLGSRAIKLVQMRQHARTLSPVAAARVELTSAPIDSATCRFMAQHLRSAITEGRFAGRRCVVSLPRTIVHTQSVRLPKMPDSELRQAAVWEASQRSGVDRDDLEVELIRTGAELQGSESREEILLVVARKDEITRWMEPILAAGLRPVAVEPQYCALARMLGRHIPPEGSSLAVIDVGIAGSTVMILRGSRIAFCKSIDICGRQFDQAVAEHLQMDTVTARDLRAGRIAMMTGQPVGRPVTDPSIDRAVFDAVRPLFASFAKEVMLCIAYHGVAFRGHPPQRLILTGGDGLEPHLGEVLACQCKLEIDLDDELTDRVQALSSSPTGPGAWWTVAAGLSLRGLMQTTRAQRRAAA